MKVEKGWSLHRNSKPYTGAFPEGFMRKLNSLLNLEEKRTLHLFGGIISQDYNIDTNDINIIIPATFHFDARKEFPIRDNTYDAVICDPPYDCPSYKVKRKDKNGKRVKAYSEAGFIHTSDKKKKLHYGKNLYNTPFVPPYSFVNEAVRVCKPGGFIIVLHFLVYKQPQNAKRYKLIPVICGPNLRIRVLNIFQKGEG